MSDKTTIKPSGPNIDLSTEVLCRITSGTGAYHPDFDTEEGFAERIILAFLDEMEEQRFRLTKF